MAVDANGRVLLVGVVLDGSIAGTTYGQGVVAQDLLVAKLRPCVGVWVLAKEADRS